MLKKDFWYDLPKELIAQEPADPRDSARLMVLSQKDDSIQHKIFLDLPECLEPGDLLVVNNSKVLPARIVGVKQPTGAVCELLLLRQVKGDQWECLAKPGKRMQPGQPAGREHPHQVFSEPLLLRPFFRQGFSPPVSAPLGHGIA